MKLLIKIILIVSLSSNLSLAKGRFESFGDAMRFLPLYVGMVSASLGDWEGLYELALGTAVTQLATEGIKRGLEAYAENGNQASMQWAKRPINNDYKGMPSGHASGAFSAASFVYYRYGWKVSIPVTILATLTAASRVYAKKHSILQVSVGAGLAWGFGYLFTKPKNFTIMPIVDKDSGGGDLVGASVSYRF